MAPVLFAAEQTHCSTAQNKAVNSDNIIQMCTLLEGQKKTNQNNPNCFPLLPLSTTGNYFHVALVFFSRLNKAGINFSFRDEISQISGPFTLSKIG